MSANKLANNLNLVQAGQSLSLLVLLGFLLEPLVLSLSVTCITLVSVRIFILYFAPAATYRLHQNWLKNLSALLVAVLITAQSHSIGLLNAMVNLLYSGACLWLVTLPVAFQSDRVSEQFIKDNEKLNLLLFFLLAVAFIYDQSLLMALAYSVTLFFCLSLLLLLHNPYFQLSSLLGLFSKKLLWSIPLASVMFLVLPNLPPFWKLPEQQTAATGLDDEMTPGDIAELAQSNRLAFRVQFDSQQVPSRQDMYWRVMTMEEFDGKQWRVADARKQQNNFYQAPSRNTATSDLSYSVIAEATQQPWLYGLTAATSPSPKVFEGRDNRLSYPSKVTQRFKYQVFHYEVPANQQLIAREKQANLILPRNMHPETKALSDRLWRAELAGDTTADYVQRILQYFRLGGFRYSLQPERLSGDHIDDFLFNKKVGFCAHFASATSVLFRLKGIPSRIVTGYQGGEFNPNGNYYNIYDNAAHAWVEYWQEQPNTAQGRWVRVDPTAAVAPDRINFDLASVLAEELSAVTQPLEVVKNIAWLNAIRQQMQSLDYYWTVWVLDFDQQDQKQLWRQLSQGDFSGFKWFGGFVLSLLALLLVAKLLKPQAAKPWHLIAINKLEKKLSRLHPNLNLARTPHMTLQSYGVFLSKNCPQQAEKIDFIITHIDFACYCHPSAAQKKQVFQAIKAL